MFLLTMRNFMNCTQMAGSAAGVALFYCTLVGVCQSVAVPQKPTVRSPVEVAASSATPGSSASVGTSIKFIATGAKADGLTPKSCQEVLAVLLPTIQAYPHPNGWTWFVACDEDAWARIQRQQGNQVGSGILAITNRPAHATILRGSAMLHAYSEDPRAQPEHIVAHELCHIYLQSSDESKVDDLATRWMKERKAKRLATLSP